MHPADRIRKRVAEAIGGIILSIIATIVGAVVHTLRETAPATEPATSASISLFTGLITSLPGFVTIAGIIGATVISGPFGFIGAIFEVVGANQLFYYQNESGFWMILIGATLVTVGAPIPWVRVFEWFSNSDSRY